METTSFDVTAILLTSHHILNCIRPATTADLLACIAFCVTAFAYITRGFLWQKPDPYYHVFFERPQQNDTQVSGKDQTTRNIAQKLEEGDHQAVVFWGSQSGTAERFAEQLARDCSRRFNLNALAADLSDYDTETISLIPRTKFAIFIMSTYGEGDPSDNATAFWSWIRQAENVNLSSLRFVAFGLGNSNYKYYNRVVEVVVDALRKFGASPMMPVGMADDANGATEEDFLGWKDDLFNLFRRELKMDEMTVEYQPALNVQYGGIQEDMELHQGNPTHPLSNSKTAAACSDIAALTIRNTRELFSAGDRNCIHMELDLADHPGIHYKTGDHVAVWPSNPEGECKQLLTSLGLQDQENTPLAVDPVDTNGKAKVPSPTTLRTIFQHHLEVCAPVSRNTAIDLVQFAPTPEARSFVQKVSHDKQHYAEFVARTHVTFGRLLRLASPTRAWSALPLSFVIESIPFLQPRYYSISSSSVISPRKIAITAVVSNASIRGTPPQVIHGLTSNYLLSMSKLPNNSLAAFEFPTYDLAGPANVLRGAKVFAHVRKSKFKLPAMSSTPMIMIAAGTGYAPFRAFIAERAKLHSIGKPVGKMVLFFGCRKPEEDFIYREELDKMKESLGDSLEIITAFSRASGERKIYVQDRVMENGAKVLELLDAGSSLFVCGKASMAREVDKRIESAAKMTKTMTDDEVKRWSEGLKRRGKWRADVWG